MIYSNIAWRAVLTFAFVCVWCGSAFAESVLNFTSRGLSGIGITNTASYAANVKFTLYNADGALVTTAAINPVGRRVPAGGQISVVPAVDLFRVKGEVPQTTWMQVSSSIDGLEGFYLAGDSGDASAKTAVPLTVQTIPQMSGAQGAVSLVLTNPAAQPANATVTFFNASGSTVKVVSVPLASRAQTILAGAGASARVVSDVAILATAVHDAGKSPVMINGQGAASQGLTLVAPYFRNDQHTRSSLVLNNPSSAKVSVRISFFAEAGGQRSAATITLPGNGSASMDWRTISGLPIGASDGWLRVDATTPVGGLVVVTRDGARTALPLQSAPLDRPLFSRLTLDAGGASSLNLIGNEESSALVTITLKRPDGSAVSQNEIQLPPLFKVSGKVGDLVPVPSDFSGGFVTIQSTTPVYGLEFTEFGPGPRPAREFPAGPIVALPRILSAKVSDNPDGVQRLKVVGQNIGDNPTLSVGGRVVPLSPASDGEYSADLPDLEPGFISVKVRAGGLDSDRYLVGVYPDEAEFVTRRGQALFQKIEVTDSGLDPARTVMVPVRNARVEVLDRVTQQIVSVTETDEDGEFVAAVPDRPGLTIRALSRLRSGETRVVDNFSGQSYAITRDIDDPRDSSDIEIVDTSRVSGAFNILDAVQQGNALVAQADAQLVPPPLTIYWSERNNEAVLARLTGGQIRTTFFNLSTNTAYVLGDRNSDSDEFDDSVILHEYAHMLAARFSRDDSPGGLHVLGDLLDPRVAWSEGWANFFAAAVRGTSVFVDSKGLGVGLRYDLEENVPVGDRQGYWSESSVHGLLWDLFDANEDNGDTVEVPFASIWKAFTELRNDRFVYLPFFLEHFMEQNPGLVDALRLMVVLRNIDFQPDVRPSVVNPFPRLIAIGEARVLNEVDSLTSRRTNLANSSHFYRFTTRTGGQTYIRLEIDGLGPANNPAANDLDLFLFDANGNLIDQADGHAKIEQIGWISLPAGTYYVEVRSFYTRAETNTVVFNSGRYRLSVQIQ